MLSWPSPHFSAWIPVQDLLLSQRRKMFKVNGNTGTKQVRGWSNDVFMGREWQNPELSVCVIYSCHQCKAWDPAELWTCCSNKCNLFEIICHQPIKKTWRKQETCHVNLQKERTIPSLICIYCFQLTGQHFFEKPVHRKLEISAWLQLCLFLLLTHKMLMRFEAADCKWFRWNC